MIISKTFCDICHKECDPKRFGMIAGTVMKLNEQAKIKIMGYEGHLCEEDFLKVADFIENLKNAQDNNTSKIPQESVKEGSDK